MAILAPEFYAKNRAEWRKWLAKNHSAEKSVWLVYDKGKERQLSYDDIVEEALCFGWVDSVPGKVSETRSKLYISKRKAKSAWSKTNKERVEKLMQSGAMMKAGLEAITLAKENGAWDLLNKSDNLERPPELDDLLNKNIPAKEFYFSMSASSQKLILEWIYQAKTEQTKMKRINETVELAKQGIKAHHYRQ